MRFIVFSVLSSFLMLNELGVLVSAGNRIGCAQIDECFSACEIIFLSSSNSIIQYAHKLSNVIECKDVDKRRHYEQHEYRGYDSAVQPRVRGNAVSLAHRQGQCGGECCRISGTGGGHTC